MKIVLLKTGATCVTVPDEELIFVDPDLSREAAVEEIQRHMPGVLPDIIDHWAEEVWPTTTPLFTLLAAPAALAAVSEVPPAFKRNDRPRGAHRAARRIGSIGKQMTTAALTAGLAIVVAPLIQGQHPPVAAAAEAWENDVFTRVETGSKWECRGTDSSDLIATCVTPDGSLMHAEAWVGPNSLTFTFTYSERQPDGLLRPHRNTLMVFSSESGREAWLKSTPSLKAFPNLALGPRWVLYGTDAARLDRWADRLGERLTLPADVSQAAFEMGLLPSPERTASNKREMSNVPKVVRDTAARILVGDATLPIPTANPTFPLPGGGAVFPLPAGPKSAPVPPIQAPAPAPVPVPSPPQSPVPVPPPPPPTDPATPVPTDGTTPPATDPPQESPPEGDPGESTPPTDEAPDQGIPEAPPAGEAPEEGTPETPPATPETPEQGTPEGPPADEAPEEGTPETPPATPETPEQGTPEGPPTDETPDQGVPPAQGDPTSPPVGDESGEDGVAELSRSERDGPVERRSVQHVDALTGPIEVPANAPAPLYEEGVRTPIFSSVAADMAVRHSQAPSHARGLPFVA